MARPTLGRAPAKFCQQRRRDVKSELRSYNSLKTMLSLRAWVERFPSQVRLFVATLAMLSFVAPTWHVCSMGGHVMSMSDGASHEMAGMTHTKFQRTASGALLCFCVAHNAPPKPTTAFRLNGRMVHNADCLALMLATMSATLASPISIERNSLLQFSAFAQRREFPTREFIRTFCGRGPPVVS